MDVHQCPRCELRFVTDSEVRDHLVSDHGVEPETLEKHPVGWTRELRERRLVPDLMHPLPPPS